MILEVSNIHTFYGQSHILFGVSLAVERRQAVCLVGRNGAGKTTTLRSIMGLTPPRMGSIRFKNEEITGKPPFVVCRRGIGLVPENNKIFPDLTVRENLEVVPKRLSHGRDHWTVDTVYSLFSVLQKLDKRRAGSLSGGEQQMLGIGRTLMSDPELLLLDEPSEGLAPVVVDILGEQIQKLKESGITMVIADQNVKFSAKWSERVFIMEKGMIRYQGTVAELMEYDEARKTYLEI